MVLRKWNIAACMLVLGVASAVIASGRYTQVAQALPPLGQRLYGLGQQQSVAPVVIAPAKASSLGRYMRDPDQPGHLNVLAPHRIVAHKQPELKEKPGNLRFQRLRVTGHLQQPRVAFRLDPLPLERADEPISKDFYPKVFEPAKDDAF
jgi:hypothetical protein